MLKKFILISCTLLISQAWAAVSSSFDKALEKLIEGNERFAKGKSTHNKWDQESRRNKSASQSPFAVVLACSDSRTAPELIFDQGLGDLFVVRVAGNVVGEMELASIEFAVAHLHPQLIMVLGHQSCGAVKTAISESEQLSELRAIYPLILSSIDACKKAGGTTNKLSDAIHCNVMGSMSALKASPVLSSYLDQKKVKMVGGYYDFDSGKVELIFESSAPQKQQVAH